MFQRNLEKVVNRKNLTHEEMMESIGAIMNDEINESQKAGFLTALTIKGETTHELYGAAKKMRDQATSIVGLEDTLDTCGTGGDGKHTFNISTVAAIIASAAGVKIVKHGNRSVSSKCGSADVLEALGVNLRLNKSQVKEAIVATNFGFLFAPDFHPAMKNVMNTRKSLGFRTIFNLLGPLTNPTATEHQIIGVYDEQLTVKFAEVLKKLGVKRALVVHGSGLDEISLSGQTTISELDHGEIKNYTIHPNDFGLSTAPIEAIVGGGIEQNKQIFLDILANKPSPKRDIARLNAGAAIYINGKAKSIAEGIKQATDVLEDNKAQEKLNEYIEFSRRYL